MIDWSSQLECYETHSLYQRAIYIKSTVYLGLNMMVVPSLSLGNKEASQSIYNLIV